MGLIYKFYERYHRRLKAKDSIDDRIQQIVECWMMLEVSKLSIEHAPEKADRWLKELCSHLEPGIRKIHALGYQQKAIDKLVDEVLISDAHLDNKDIVQNISKRKLRHEQIPLDLGDILVDKWLIKGLHEISDVFKNDNSSVDYEERKKSELQSILEEIRWVQTT
jgi:hypothetical protein